MSITLASPLMMPEKKRAQKALTTVAGIPVYVYAVSLASLFTITGVLWDISWHTTIGRDKFLSPPHLLIYLGAIIGGLFSGIQILINTFSSSAVVMQSLVKIWGIFYSSLGALFCIWGAIAMLTSAPFDDWWHNTYGLDVVILSPPHALLAMGMFFLPFGACVSITKYLNRLEEPGSNIGIATINKQKNILRLLFVVASASLLCMVCTLLNEYLDTRNQRGGLFYKIAPAAILLFLPALGRTLRMRWGMTAITFMYFLIFACTNWILQLFPAVPKLGPILNPVTHFQPFQFPLLLIIPALAMDSILFYTKVNDWKKAILLSIVFMVLLLAVQYPFSGFLLQSPGSRNWFFGSESWYYGLDPNWEFRYKFQPEEVAPLPALIKAIGIGVIIGFFVARLSLRWGKWMLQIQR